MEIRPLVIASSLALAVGSSASAGIVVTTDSGVWGVRNAVAGLTPVSADLGSIQDGYYVSGTSWTSGAITWTGSAAGGLYVKGAKLSTNNPVPLTISFGAGVKSFAAVFSATDIDFGYLPGRLFEINLDNGTVFTGLTQSLGDPNRAFVGFVATGTSVITGFTIAVDSLGGPEAYATVENMFFAVPAPGALTLVGAAALVGANRRRR